MEEIRRGQAGRHTEVYRSETLSYSISVYIKEKRGSALTLIAPLWAPTLTST